MPPWDLYSDCMHVQVCEGSSVKFYETHKSVFSKMIWSGGCTLLVYEAGKGKLISPSYRDGCCLSQNSLSTNNNNTALAMQLYYISLWVLLLCLEQVNECSLSLHNHVALIQLSTVLFWCVSLFPTAYPSNQLWSISDFLSSLINWGWPCGPEENPS